MCDDCKISRHWICWISLFLIVSSQQLYRLHSNDFFINKKKKRTLYVEITIWDMLFIKICTTSSMFHVIKQLPTIYLTWKILKMTVTKILLSEYACNQSIVLCVFKNSGRIRHWVWMNRYHMTLESQFFSFKRYGWRLITL